MRLSPSLPSTALLSIALLCASGQALASNTHPAATDDGTACPETPTAASTVPTDETDGDAALGSPAHRTQKAKQAPAVRGTGGGGNRTTTPRWHSFLPGMFR